MDASLFAVESFLQKTGWKEILQFTPPRLRTSGEDRHGRIRPVHLRWLRWTLQGAKALIWKVGLFSEAFSAFRFPSLRCFFFSGWAWGDCMLKTTMFIVRLCGSLFMRWPMENKPAEEKKGSEFIRIVLQDSGSIWKTLNNPPQSVKIYDKSWEPLSWIQ